jgi:methylated-DNA-protein-cysteine methyltransferase-like protein
VGAADRTLSAAAFDRAVYALVRRVPRGRAVSYGQIAAMLGRPRAARAVGGAMRRCPAGVPWHRVVNAQGRISRRSRAAGMVTQRLMLEREGVTFRRGRVDLARHRWHDGRARRARDDDGAAAAHARATPGTATPGAGRGRRAGPARLRIDDERAWGR